MVVLNPWTVQATYVFSLPIHNTSINLHGEGLPNWERFRMYDGISTYQKHFVKEKG